jgi:hypothetical protein
VVVGISVETELGTTNDTVEELRVTDDTGVGVNDVELSSKEEGGRDIRAGSMGGMKPRSKSETLGIVAGETLPPRKMRSIAVVVPPQDVLSKSPPWCNPLRAHLDKYPPYHIPNQFQLCHTPTQTESSGVIHKSSTVSSP